jgi:CDGSH-type Zn-finger protein/uncharacterized Fe-S cluster protein YjdI
MMSKEKIKTYHGKHIDVSFDASRCSHGGDCLKNLPSVFNLKARPWINLEDCETQDVIGAVRQCPSGALQIHESADTSVSMKVVRGGPLNIRGNLVLKSEFKDAGTNLPRVSLCRCGLSKNKPFCDASHRKHFKDAGKFNKRPAAATSQEPTQNVDIICVENGPVMCRGNIAMQSSDGENITVIDPALCRCGASSNKPFCDGSHNKIDFNSSNEAAQD